MQADHIDFNMNPPPPTSPFPVSTNTVMVTVFTGVLIFGNTVPFYSLYSAKQLPGATMIAVLIIVLCLNFINAIIWSNNHIASWWNGHILCDIEVSIKQVLSTMVASSTACMTGNLAKAVDVENNPMMFESSAMRRRRIVFELIFIFGIPFIQLCTHYVVQSGRYAIVAVYGCTDVIDRSWPTLVIFIWPLVFSIINCYYAVLVIIRLQRHRGNLSTTLSSSGSSFTARRFMKLFVLCLLFFTLQLPATAMFFFFNLNNSLPMHSYSWSQVHDPKLWPYIMYFTSEQVPTQQYYGWPVVIMGLTSFAFYGCNVEATERYRLLLVKCGVGRIWPAVLAPRERRRRRGSGNESRASWTSHLDVIGKTVKYFDNKRKHSHASTEEHENVLGSRNDSTATFGLSRIPSTCISSTTTPWKLSNPGGHSHSPTSVAYLATSAQNLDEATLSPTPPFSSMRRYLNLHFPFTSKHRSTAKQVDTAKQIQYEQPSVVQTVISSGSATSCISNPRIEEEDDGPKKGPRVYRERELRETEREKTLAKKGIEVEKQIDQRSTH